MQIEDLQVVLKVAKHGSITGAANSLDMQVATASAALKRIEKQLGASLFIRSTRQLRLSAAGERFLPHCQRALDALLLGQQVMREQQVEVEGELRIAMSSDLGRNVVLPWLDEFAAEHPKLSLRLNIGDRNIDFYRDEVDMALRYGSPSDSGLYGFKICDVPGVLCAAPSYLEKHGEPTTLAALPEHNGLFYQLHDLTHDTWLFLKDEESHKVKMKGNRTSNDADLVRRWCVSGQGIAVKSCLDLYDDLMAGRLQPLLPDYRPRCTELWLVCLSQQSITPTMRLLRDFLQKRFAERLDHLREQGIISNS